jgi:lipopolysaccharide/colanic/teichoic acid biosynthesis glycosyltransferase
MKSLLSKIVFILSDSAMLVLSLVLAFLLRDLFVTLDVHTIPIATYTTFYPLYIIILGILFYEGIYSFRYDFWHETRLILKGLLLAALIVFAYLAMTKTIENYSRLVIGISFICMAVLIPLSKNVLKRTLFRLGLWQKRALIHGNDHFLTEEIYNNHYLGYIRPNGNKTPPTLFINPKGSSVDGLQTLLSNEIKQKHEVIFIPLMEDYDLTHSHIYELSNTRTNLIVYTNRLKSWYRRVFQESFNYLLALLLLPFLLPLIGIFAILIKLESPGPLFFTHKRMGRGGKVIPTYKFRSMYHDAQERLDKLLKEDMALKEEWEKHFKLKNDPRITKIGAFLRRTSLDELPQIFNILRGEMNFVGPRPVTKEEIALYYKEDAEYYSMVKPGITGLWQVGGRSDTDYDHRVKIDKWYVLNWSLWLDIVILLKTVKVVLKQEGAY